MNSENAYIADELIKMSNRIQELEAQNKRLKKIIENIKFQVNGVKNV